MGGDIGGVRRIDSCGHRTARGGSAGWGALNRIVGKDGADRLREWVRNGGTLITFGGASAWAARENINLTSARAVGADAKPDSGGAGAKPDTSAAGRRAQVARDSLDLLAVTSPSATSGSPGS